MALDSVIMDPQKTNQIVTKQIPWNLLTNFMEANRFWAKQEIPRILWNTKVVPYRIQIAHHPSLSWAQRIRPRCWKVFRSIVKFLLWGVC
jgi:hypothetical protein